MNYTFRVNIKNDNYPLHILWKVNTFSEYQHVYVNNSETPGPKLSYDSLNDTYYYDVEFSITNYTNSSNIEEHNNLSCIDDAGDFGSKKLTIDVISFQEGVGSAFNNITLMTDEQWRDPFNAWDGFAEFVYEYGSQETYYAVKKSTPSNQGNMNCYTAWYLYRFAIEIPGELNSVITRDIDLYSNNNKITLTDIVLTKTTGDWFVGEIGQDRFSLGLDSNGPLKVALKDDTEYFYYFTTLANIPLNTSSSSEGKYNVIKDNIDDDTVEVFFNGQYWTEYMIAYNMYSPRMVSGVDPTQNNNGCLVGRSGAFVTSFCSADCLQIELTKTTDYDTASEVFGISPCLLIYKQGFNHIVKVDDLTTDYLSNLDKFGLVDAGCGISLAQDQITAQAGSGLVTASSTEITQQS
jgi:hypothetical protein